MKNRKWRKPLHPTPYRVWYHSNLHESDMMMPVYELTAEYMHKDRTRIFASTLENNHEIGMSTHFRVDAHRIHRNAILMRNSDVRDRAGRFIYDGDILQIGFEGDPSYERALCFYDKGTFSFSYFSKVINESGEVVDGAWWGEGWEPYIGKLITPKGRIRNWKIIGNICENPELLGFDANDVRAAKSIVKIVHN